MTLWAPRLPNLLDLFQADDDLFPVKGILGDGCALRWAFKFQPGGQCFGRDVITVRFDRGPQVGGGLDEQLDPVGDIQLGALAQVLHAADEFTGQPFTDQLGGQIGDQRGDIGAILGDGKALLRHCLDLHLLRQDIKYLALCLDMQRFCPPGAAGRLPRCS